LDEEANAFAVLRQLSEQLDEPLNVSVDVFENAEVKIEAVLKELGLLRLRMRPNASRHCRGTEQRDAIEFTQNDVQQFVAEYIQALRWSWWHDLGVKKSWYEGKSRERNVR